MSTNSKDTYEQIYKVICSRKTEDKLKKLLPAIKKSTEYINQITTDKKVEGIATVLYIIETNYQISTDDIIKNFREWSEDKANRFSRKYICECIDYLEQTNIVIKDIFGNYEIARGIWN